jgi:hypothetical protein
VVEHQPFLCQVELRNAFRLRMSLFRVFFSTSRPRSKMNWSSTFCVTDLDARGPVTKGVETKRRHDGARGD